LDELRAKLKRNDFEKLSLQETIEEENLKLKEDTDIIVKLEDRKKDLTLQFNKKKDMYENNIQSIKLELEQYKARVENNNEDVWKDKYFDELERSYGAEKAILELQIELESFIKKIKERQ